MSTIRTVLILIGVISGVVAGLAAFLWHMAPDTGGGVVSGHGTIAMVLGVVLSLIVGIGLMALVFYSSRRGYDDEAAGYGEDRRSVRRKD